MNLKRSVALRFGTFVVGVLSMLDLCSASEFCDSKIKSSDSDQARILRGLSNLKFSAESHNDGSPSEFTISVCGNASKSDPLAGVLQNYTTVLGRVNNTSVVRGGDWMMMMFGSGDLYPEKYNCSGPRVAFVMIHCNHNISAENSMRFIKEAREEKNSCFFMFEVHSQLVCPQPEIISGGTIFLVLLLVAILAYSIGGFLYRRLVLGAKGIEQIPNLPFWTSISKGITDKCRSVCCQESSTHSNSWENLGSRAERDDDSLLAS